MNSSSPDKDIFPTTGNGPSSISLTLDDLDENEADNDDLYDEPAVNREVRPPRSTLFDELAASIDGDSKFENQEGSEDTSSTTRDDEDILTDFVPATGELDLDKFLESKTVGVSSPKGTMRSRVQDTDESDTQLFVTPIVPVKTREIHRYGDSSGS